MLRSPKAPGRHHLLSSYDERVPSYYDFLPNAPTPIHIAGMQTMDWKLGTYSNWAGGITLPNGINIPGAVIDPATLQREFYDYSTRRGRLELDNLGNDPARARQLDRLFRVFLEEIIPNELRAPLPAAYVPAQTLAKIGYLVYAYLLTRLQPSDPQDPGAPPHGFGRDF